MDIFRHLEVGRHFDVLRDVYFLADSSLLLDFCNDLFDNAYASFVDPGVAHRNARLRTAGVRRRGPGGAFLPGSLLCDEHRLNRILTSSTTAARTNAHLAQNFSVALVQDPPTKPLTPSERRQAVLRGRSHLGDGGPEMPFDRLRLECVVFF